MANHNRVAVASLVLLMMLVVAAALAAPVRRSRHPHQDEQPEESSSRIRRRIQQREHTTTVAAVPTPVAPVPESSSSPSSSSPSMSSPEPQAPTSTSAPTPPDSTTSGRTHTKTRLSPLPTPAIHIGGESASGACSFLADATQRHEEKDEREHQCRLYQAGAPKEQQQSPVPSTAPEPAAAPEDARPAAYQAGKAVPNAPATLATSARPSLYPTKSQKRVPVYTLVALLVVGLVILCTVIIIKSRHAASAETEVGASSAAAAAAAAETTHTGDSDTPSPLESKTSKQHASPPATPIKTPTKTPTTAPATKANKKNKNKKKQQQQGSILADSAASTPAATPAPAATFVLSGSDPDVFLSTHDGNDNEEEYDSGSDIDGLYVDDRNGTAGSVPRSPSAVSASISDSITPLPVTPLGVDWLNSAGQLTVAQRHDVRLRDKDLKVRRLQLELATRREQRLRDDKERERADAERARARDERNFKNDLLHMHILRLGGYVMVLFVVVYAAAVLRTTVTMSTIMARTFGTDNMLPNDWGILDLYDQAWSWLFSAATFVGSVLFLLALLFVCSQIAGQLSLVVAMAGMVWWIEDATIADIMVATVELIVGTCALWLIVWAYYTHTGLQQRDLRDPKQMLWLWAAYPVMLLFATWAGWVVGGGPFLGVMARTLGGGAAAGTGSTTAMGTTDNTWIKF